jgi:hypothetical protein
MVETVQSTEAEGRRPVKLAAATIWCDVQLLRDFKASVKLQGRTLADELNELFRRRLDELRGTVKPGTSDEEAGRKYEELKAKHAVLFNQVKKMVERLKESSESRENFENAKELLIKLSMKADFSNAQDVIPMFIEAWKGDQDFLHEYLSLVEAAVNKRQVEKLLISMRLAKYPKLDVATVAPAQTAMATTPATPQQNKEKTLIEEEEPHNVNLQEDEDRHGENTGEDDDEEKFV